MLTYNRIGISICQAFPYYWGCDAEAHASVRNDVQNISGLHWLAFDHTTLDAYDWVAPVMSGRDAHTEVRAIRAGRFAVLTRVVWLKTQFLPNKTYK